MDVGLRGDFSTSGTGAVSGRK